MSTVTAATFGRRKPGSGALDLGGIHARASGRNAERAARLWHVLLIGGAIASTTVFQKFVLPIGGDMPISLGLILIAGLTGAGLVAGRLVLHGPNLTLYLLIATALIGTQIIGGETFSAASLALLLAIHLPYVFRFRDPLSDPHLPLRLYQNVALFVSVAGILQFLAQFAIGWQNAFLLDTAVPEGFIDPGYHQLNPIGSSGHLYKANGFFMLEASLLSQAAAVALLIELLWFRRPFRYFVYAAAMVVAYSGTGVMLLALLVPIMAVRRGRFDLLMLAVAAVMLIRAFADDLHLTMFFDREGEFSNIRSSGFARFISPFYLIDDFQIGDVPHLLWGYGAGNITRMNSITYYLIHDPTWGKMIFEYGAVGALVYFPCFVRLLKPRDHNGYLVLALLVQYLVMGGYLLTPVVHALFLALLVWPWPAADGMPRRSAPERFRRAVRHEPYFEPTRQPAAGS